MVIALLFHHDSAILKVDILNNDVKYCVASIRSFFLIFVCVLDLPVCSICVYVVWRNYFSVKYNTLWHVRVYKYTHTLYISFLYLKVLCLFIHTIYTCFKNNSNCVVFVYVFRRISGFTYVVHTILKIK